MLMTALIAFSCENAEVLFEIPEEGTLPKYKEIKIELARPTDDREYVIGTMYDVDKGPKMILTAK